MATTEDLEKRVTALEVSVASLASLVARAEAIMIAQLGREMSDSAVERAAAIRREIVALGEALPKPPSTEE